MPHLPLLGALPPISAGQLLSTTPDPLPISILAAVLVLYLSGVARNNRLHPRHRWPAGRTLAFCGGVLTTAVAILSVVGVYDDELFWDHMVQHLLLIMVAAGLFAVSSPVALLWRATSGGAHRAVTAVLRSGPAKVAGHPVTAFLAYALVIPLTHLTVFMTLVLETTAVHHVEHVLFVVVGYLFWRQVLGEDPGGGRLHPAMKALYLFLAVPVDTFVGLTLSLENSEIFPREAAVHRTWGPSLVTDLHIGGVIMWVGGDVLMMLAFIPVIVQWVRLDERHALRADRELVDYFPPPVHARQPTAGFALGTAKRRKGT
jgi:cytochrome c oxidase assembly factor CtaG